MRVNGNLRGLAWAAAGGAVYSPTQTVAVPGATGGASGGSPYYVPAAAPMAAPAPQIRPVALVPVARPLPPTTRPGTSLGPSVSAPAAVVNAPVTDGTLTPLIAPGTLSSPTSPLPIGLLVALLFGSQ